MPNLKLLYSPLNTLTTSSEFGRRFSPSSHESKPHQGMDFAAVEGTDLYNAHNGTVIFSGTLSNYGTAVVIQDSGEDKSGQSTLYAHLKESLVKKGDKLTKKTLIGKTGNSGTAAFHLHFEVFTKKATDDMIAEDRGPEKKDTRLNPRTYIADSSFASKLSIEVHSGDAGLVSREGDWRDNKMVRDAKGQMQQIANGKFQSAPMKFYGLEGDDEYALLSSYSGVTKIQVLDKDGKKTYQEVTQSKIYSDDSIVDVDNDGSITIDGIKVESPFFPKYDTSKNKVEGQ